MKRRNLFFHVKITAGLMDLAYRTKEVWITEVSCADEALQTAIFWSESFWYPDWLTIEVNQLSSDCRLISGPMYFKRQLPIFNFADYEILNLESEIA